MRRDKALAILAAHRDDLRERYGVKSLALFGSVARDEAGPASDIDLLVEFDRSIGLFHLFDTQHFLEDLLGRAVDLTPRNSIRPELRDIILAEAINAPREWRLRITDILDAIARIQRYTADLTEDAFVNDERTRDAVIRNLEVIGEASRHVPDEIKAGHPEIPWRSMLDMRNFAVHQYEQINLGIIWSTIQDDIPPLVPRLQRILAGTGEDTNAPR